MNRSNQNIVECISLTRTWDLAVGHVDVIRTDEDAAPHDRTCRGRDCGERIARRRMTAHAVGIARSLCSLFAWLK